MSILSSFRLRVCLCFLLATPCVASVAVADKLPGAFPLIGWWGPLPTAEELAAYRRAHLNLLPVTLGEVSVPLLDEALRRGLRVMLVWPPDTSPTRSQINDDLLGHPAIMACMVAEGEGPEWAEHAARRALAVRHLGAGWSPVAPLAIAGRGTPDAERWQEEAKVLAEAGIPVMPIILPFAADGSTDEPLLHTVLKRAAAIAEEAQVPLWGTVQITEHADRRRASESDIRMQAYSSLAHGARGLAYLSYGLPRRGHGEAFRSVDYQHPMGASLHGGSSYAHDVARALNAEIRTIAPLLAPLRHRGVYFAGEIPEGCEALQPGNGPILRIRSPRAMVGFYEGSDGEQWALVVNRNHGARRSARTQGRTLEIEVAPEVTSAVAIDRNSGFEIPVPLDQGRFTITLPGGTGNLLRLERSPQTTD